VDRNRAKRILREGFRLVAEELPPDSAWILVGRSALRDKCTVDVMNEIRKLNRRFAALKG